MTVSATRGSVVPLISALTTGTGLGVAVPNSSHYPRIHARGSGTISGGTVIIEEALDPDYTGTWSLLATLTAVSFTGGAEQVIHILGNIGAIRARISSDITGGGNMSVDLITS